MSISKLFSRRSQILATAMALFMLLGCAGAPGPDGGGGNDNDNGGGGGDGDGSGGGNGGGGQTDAAIVKTRILVGNGGRIDVGDDLIVFGVGSDEDVDTPLGMSNQPAGVHYLVPSQATGDTDTGKLIANSDLLFGHQNFRVARKKIALVRSTNAVSIYDTTTDRLTDIDPSEITLQPLPLDQAGPGHMMADGPYIATINDDGPNLAGAVADGREIKLIDISAADPRVISFPQPEDFDDNEDFSMIAVDADARRVVAVSVQAKDLYAYNIDQPEDLPTKFDFDINTDTGVLDNETQIEIDGDFVIFHDQSSTSPAAAILDLRDGTVTRLSDNPTLSASPVAVNGGSFAYFLDREDADAGDEFNSRRTVIGALADAPASTATNSQLRRYDLRATTVDLAVGSITRPEQSACQNTGKLIGYGATSCITPDGERIFVAGWRNPDREFDYVQMSTGGEFADFADPEGSTLTGSLMGADIVCSADTAAFRGLREVGIGQGCITDQQWVISFIVLDRLP